MSIKKVTLAVVSTMLTILLMTMPNIAKAYTDLTPTIYFGVNEFRTGTTPNNIGYAIGDPAGNTSTNLVAAKIWQIKKFTSNSASEQGTTGNFYCVRAGVGFQNTNDRAAYNRAYNLKTYETVNNAKRLKCQRELQNSGNTYLQSFANNGYYTNLLALTDLMYLQGVSSAADRTRLLTAAGIDNVDEYPGEFAITDSDIEAVQQAAVWYFTNHDDTYFNNIYNNLGLDKTSWLFYSTGGGYTSLSNYGPVDGAFSVIYKGAARQEQAVLLYNYLINTANANASRYENGTAVPKTKVTLYSNSAVENTQPIILIEKLPDTKFDLSLRKYITKVGTTTLTGTNSRVPEISVTSLATDTTVTTASYNHKKDPVTVQTGTEVTYNLSVYNEGDKAGRAKKIVDQLPTGLQLITSGTIRSNKENNYTISYDTSTNKVTFTNTGATNLNAFNGSSLDSETITIVCKVNAIANASNDTVLTNLAWISEEYDAVDGVTITTDIGADRDSEPSTITTKNANELVTTDNGYIGNSSNKADLTDRAYFYKGQQDDDDFEKIILKPEATPDDGKYNLVLVKEDENGEDLNSTATFLVNGATKQVTGRLTIAENVAVNNTTADIYTIKETIPPDEYCEFDGTITITVNKAKDGNKYKVSSVDYKVEDSQGRDITNNQNNAAVHLNANGNIYVEVKNYQFDLKLVKRIVEVNGEKVPERIENVDITKLANGTATTADYKLNKTPVSVAKGDIVKYTLRVYNEGQIDGYASEITEDIPDGLELVWSDKTGTELDADESLTEIEKEAINYNQLVWQFKDIDPDTEKVETITTDYLALGKGNEVATDGANLIKAFNKTKNYTNTINEKNPDYKEISVYLRVTAENDSKEILRNEAAITKDSDSKGKDVTDRDSKPEDWVKYEDDEDYDNVRLQTFDLALRKFIIAVSQDEELEDEEYLRTSSGTYSRAPKVDTTNLNTTDSDGKLITTATYNHTKEAVEVNKNDYVVYMLRVFNESDINGYASEIKDHLPPYLEFLDNEYNKKYGWEASEDGRTVTTKYLSNQLINKTTIDDNGIIVLSYKEVPIMCKVSKDVETSKKVTNIADITEYRDEEKNIVIDRDSQSNNVNLPEDKDLPSYKDDENGSYVPGQQDDDDFEKVIVRKFDLALRKWVTQAIVVENGKETITNTGHKAEDDPEQVVKVELHRKKINNVIVKFKYKIRVTNEGDVAGYAKEVKDYIPKGLKYVASDNKTTKWKVEGKNTITTTALANKLLKPGESATVTVTLRWINGNNNLGVKNNIAEISEDYNDKGLKDIDSTPNNKKSGEDDIDDAPVLLSVSTGSAPIYIGLGLTVLVTIAGGVVLIRKYVL